ncbi:MAG: hypothetical protein JNM84_13875, partial [Planctomycetes bacterium]|nr:hypothetical protein [Planctomycetota bacterium]
FEIGWIAWGIGAGAGAACAALGGRTQVHAILCAAIALAGIAGGKALAVHFDRLKIEKEFLPEEALRASFEKCLEDARLWCELGEDPSFEQVRSFMIQRGYVYEGEVPPRDEIDGFESEIGPSLVSDHRTPLTFAAFRERIGSKVGVLSFSEHFRATLSPFDLLWVLLGLSSAFGIVQNAGKQQQAVEQEARKAERRARRRPVPPS